MLQKLIRFPTVVNLEVLRFAISIYCRRLKRQSPDADQFHFFMRWVIGCKSTYCSSFLSYEGWSKNLSLHYFHLKVAADPSEEDFFFQMRRRLMMLKSNYLFFVVDETGSSSGCTYIRLLSTAYVDIMHFLFLEKNFTHSFIVHKKLMNSCR